MNGMERYVDGYLIEISEKIKELMQNDRDVVCIIDGYVGEGKSTLAQHLAYLVDPTFCIERIYFDCDGFKEGIVHSEKQKAHILDEGSSSLNIRRAMSNINITINCLMDEIRQRNLCIIICLPSVFDIDKHQAIQRSLFLLHTYSKNGVRGFFKMYGRRTKAKLFANDYARRTYQYVTKPNCFGRFGQGYVVDELAYRRKKDNVLKKYLKSPLDSSNVDIVKLREAEIIKRLKDAGVPYSTFTKAGLLSGCTIAKRLKLLRENTDSNSNNVEHSVFGDNPLIGE